MRNVLLFVGLASGAIGWAGLAPQIAWAQITPDGSLSTTVTQTGNTFTIDQGDRVGNNLFHSFSQFSLPTGGAAIFNNAVDVQNIFSRVTGGSVSNINGVIRANGSANLFLLNPSGILFGPNASLNIGGSFIGTTANSVKFADGVEFSAVNPTGSALLTVSVPIGLQMGTNPGEIVSQSQNSGVGLQTLSGQTLALIGGSISLPGGLLTVPNGTIALGSVGANSLVTIAPSASGWSFNYQGVENFQDIQLSQGALLDTGGLTGGEIQVQGRRVSLTGSSIESYNFGNNPVAPVNIRASESIETFETNISANALGQSGIGGDINLAAPLLRFQSSLINTFGINKTGNVTIRGNTVDFLSIPDRGPSRIVLQSASGQSGNITIEAQRVRLLNGSYIISTTLGAANAGNVTLNATESVEISGFRVFNSRGIQTIFSGGILTQTAPASRGNGGNISINTGRLSILNGSSVAANTGGSGKAGNITIRANAVEVADPIVGLTGAVSGIIVSVNSEATGQGGMLDIQTDTLRVFNGGQISAATDGQGNAGMIDIRARSIDLSGTSTDGTFRSSISARSSTQSNAGDIQLTSDRLTVSNGAEITVGNTSTGNAGTLSLSTGALLLDNGARLRAEVNGGNQGNILLRASDLLLIRGGSSIITNATGLSTGGNITITAPIVAGFENSDIIANAVQGRGGNIQITTQGIFGLKFRPQLTPANDITASSQFGVNGIVQVNTIGVDPSAGLVNLPVNLVDPTRQIATGCGGDRDSSFVATGRGGIPQNPMQEARNDRTWADTRDLSAFRTAVSSGSSSHSITPPSIVEASTLSRINGQLELVAVNSPAPLPQAATCARAIAPAP